MPDLRRVLQALGLAMVLLSAAAAAQQTPEAPSLSLPTVEVVGATPLLGSGVDRDKVPAETQVLTDQDISRNGYPQALRRSTRMSRASRSMPPPAIRFSPISSTTVFSPPHCKATRKASRSM